MAHRFEPPRLSAPALRHALSALALLHPWTTAAHAQSPAQAPAQSAPSQPATPRVPHAPALVARDTVFLDPSHGGDDTGARLRDGVLEKDVTLSLSNRLRFQLESLGLTTLATREADLPPSTATPPPTTLPTDQRAGLANHLRPFACIVLHATESGSGVHILTAALPPAEPVTLANPSLTPPLRWDTAQAESLPQSERLADELAHAVANAGLPLNRGHASIRPLSNLTCPAVLIELAPLSGTQDPADATYQSRVTQAIAAALVFWHSHADPAPPAAAESHPSAEGASSAP